MYNYYEFNKKYIEYHSNMQFNLLTDFSIRTLLSSILDMIKSILI